MSLWLFSGPLPRFSVSLSRFYDSYSFIFCDPFPSFLSVYLICMTRTVLYSVTPSPSFLSVCLISMTRTVLHSVTPSPSSLSVCLVSMARTVVSCPLPLPRFSVSLSRFYDSYSFILCDPFPQFSVSLSHFYDSYSFVFCDPLSGFLSVCLISMTCTVLSSVTLSPIFSQFVSFRWLVQFYLLWPLPQFSVSSSHLDDSNSPVSCHFVSFLWLSQFYLSLLFRLIQFFLLPPAPGLPTPFLFFLCLSVCLLY